MNFVLIDEIVLDPLAWQAVGKTMGWLHNVCSGCGEEKPCWCDTSDVRFSCGSDKILRCHYKMHCMIDSLIEGKTLEEFLATL